MRISDGSSDVCSSDLLDLHFRRLEFGNQFLGHRLLYALLDGDLAARATQVLKWIADIHATNIDTARREPAAQNIEHLVQLKNAGRRLRDYKTVEFELGVDRKSTRLNSSH